MGFKSSSLAAAGLIAFFFTFISCQACPPTRRWPRLISAKMFSRRPSQPRRRPDLATTVQVRAQSSLHILANPRPLTNSSSPWQKRGGSPPARMKKVKFNTPSFMKLQDLVSRRREPRTARTRRPFDSFNLNTAPFFSNAAISNDIFPMHKASACTCRDPNDSRPAI